MVSLLNIIASFFANYLAALLVEHSLFSDSIDPCCVSIGLLLFGDLGHRTKYRVAIHVLAQVVLEVVLDYWTAVGTDLNRGHLSLHDEGTLLTALGELLMNYLSVSVRLEKSKNASKGSADMRPGPKPGSPIAPKLCRTCIIIMASGSLGPTT